MLNGGSEVFIKTQIPTEHRYSVERPFAFLNGLTMGTSIGGNKEPYRPLENGHTD